MLPYVKLFGDTSATVDMLSDAEAGRLFKAVLHYAAGRTDELPGQEKLVFAMLVAQFERDAVSYQDYCDRQRSNGKRGGRPKKPTGFSENPENPLVFLETQKTQDVDIDKDIDVDIDKDVDGNTARAREDEPTTADAPLNADTLEAYAAGNLQYLSPRNMEELLSFRDDLPDDLIRYGIDQGCAAGKRTWAYVRAILNAYIAQGIKTVGDAKAKDEQHAQTSKQAATARSNPALNYPQRDYKPDDFGEDFFFNPLKHGYGGEDT